jgi:hypothetical protein
MLKVDIINDAYTEIRISGLTSDPVPSELEYALTKLEYMAAEWETNRNVCVGYNLEEIDADPNSEAGISFANAQAFSTNLAMRLLAAFGKSVPPSLAAQATQSYSAMATVNAVVRQTQYPERQPVGSGNTQRFYRWARFYRKQPLAPISCETEQITQGEINDYTLDVNGYLDYPEEVSSYTFDASAGFTIVSESLADGVWSYRVEASEAAESLQRVQFTAVTDLGREQTFTINFNVEELPPVNT